MLLRIVSKSKLAANSQRFCCYFLKYLKSHSPLSLREMSLLILCWKSYLTPRIKQLIDSTEIMEPNNSNKTKQNTHTTTTATTKTSLTCFSLCAFIPKQELLRVLELQALDLWLWSMHMFRECVPTDTQQMVSGWTSGSLIRLWGTNLW